GDGPQVAQRRQRDGRPPRLAETLRRQRHAVLIARRVDFGAIGDGVRPLLLGGVSRSRGSGVEGDVARPRGQRHGAGHFQHGAPDRRRTLPAVATVFLGGFGNHVAQQVVVDKGFSLLFRPTGKLVIFPDVRPGGFVPAPVGR